MSPSKRVVVVLAVALVLLTTGTLYYTKRKLAGTAAASRAPSTTGPKAPEATNSPGPATAGETRDVALTTKSFLGSLAPGGKAEAAGRERSYVVTYQVAFVRKTPAEKLKEENLGYQELMQKDPSQLAPYVFYGENIAGVYDPQHPEAIAVHLSIDKKEVHGYIDAQKVWLEPAIAPVETARYMALRDGTAVRVVPDVGSPAVLGILQGEVVEAVGKLTFQGSQWIKARFNGGESARYGFIPAGDLQGLTPANVNPSAVAVADIPRKIRDSALLLGDAERQRLSQNGFYIEAMPPEQTVTVDDMADAYQDSLYGRQYFISSDLFLHAYHLIFDRMLQDAEEKKIFPRVARLAGKLAKTTEAALRNLPSTAPADVREGVTFDLVYFSVAAKLFDNGFSVPENARAEAESLVAAIQQGKGELPSARSSKFGDEDFTQYKPRGHYEKNETLQRYFRGMMWFGRENFRVADRKMTVAAILLPGLVEKAQEMREFEAIDGPLGYLVGPQDKYTFAGYRAINKKIFGTETPSASQVSAKLDESLEAFSRAAATDLPAPRIVSEQTGLGKTQDERLKMVSGFKFLGQRYTLDGFFFNQLTSPSVGTDGNPRNLPSALDVMMLLGSSAATEEQQRAQQRQKWANYESQSKKLQEVAQESLAQRSTFYGAWLSVLNSLFLPTGSKQFFTLGKAWQYKNLNAGAASWTELKHDTILYAEQSGAEMGEGGEFFIPPYEPPGPKGYVEPNPAFFRRQAESIEQMLSRLKQSDFLSDEYLEKFTTLHELARKAEAIAQKEISGSALSTQDYDWIAGLQASFGSSLLWPQGFELINDPSQLQMALIADVATDAVEGQVLEVATGTPQRITVVVKDAYGGTRLTIGYVYSWYEFDSRERWTDTEWKKVMYAADSAAKKQKGVEPPSWYAAFSKN